MTEEADTPAPKEEADTPAPNILFASFILLACLAQLLSLYYHPRANLPLQSSVEAGDRLVQLIRETDGDVFVPAHGYLSTLGGKNVHAHGVAIGDVLAGNGPEGAKLQQQMYDAVSDRKFKGLVFDALWNDWVGEEIKTRAVYSEKIVLAKDGDSLMPLTGFKTRPETMYRIPQ